MPSLPGFPHGFRRDWTSTSKYSLLGFSIIIITYMLCDGCTFRCGGFHQRVWNIVLLFLFDGFGSTSYHNVTATWLMYNCLDFCKWLHLSVPSMLCMVLVIFSFTYFCNLNSLHYGMLFYPLIFPNSLKTYLNFGLLSDEILTRQYESKKLKNKTWRIMDDY